MAVTGSALVMKVLALGLMSYVMCVLGSRSSSVHFRVATRRNATGHWIFQTNLFQEPPRLRSATDRLEDWGTYDLAFKSLLHRGQPSLETSISLTIPGYPSDYTFYEGIGYYKIHTTDATWEVANETCDKEGGYLAIIDSKEEEAVVKRIVKEKTSLAVFVGYYREGVENFQTVLGDDVSSLPYGHWNSGKPRNVSGNNCGWINGDGVTDVFNCNSKRYFLCELPL